MRQAIWKRHATAVPYAFEIDRRIQHRPPLPLFVLRMRGAVAVSANFGDITFDAGEEVLTVSFNTGVAQHYFCSRCGI